jgi:hypothetical protein
MSEEGGVTPSDVKRGVTPDWVTPMKGKGTLGTWRFRKAGRLLDAEPEQGRPGTRRGHRGTEIGRGVCDPVLKPQQFWEALWRKAKVRTGFGKTDRPGSQGGSGKHRPWEN